MAVTLYGVPEEAYYQKAFMFTNRTEPWAHVQDAAVSVKVRHMTEAASSVQVRPRDRSMANGTEAVELGTAYDRTHRWWLYHLLKNKQFEAYHADGAPGDTGRYRRLTLSLDVDGCESRFTRLPPMDCSRTT
jgi:hypothetical protein